MCGYDLRNQPQGRRRFSWIDILLVAAVLAVLVFWWRIGTESVQETDTGEGVQAILPTNIPLIEATATPTPTDTPPPTATPVPLVQETVLIRHVVEPGETLLSLAIEYDVSVEEIQRANNLSSELIRVGDELQIPVLREGAAGQLNAPSNDFEYIVLTGDTLSTIATRFGSSVADIQSANNLAANDFIRPGDRLIIPVRGAPPAVLAVTPEPTLVPGVAPESVPTAVIYVEPRLITPEDGVTIDRADPVIFQWASVDLLAPNEWYVLQVLPRSLTAATFPTAWTKQTSYRLGTELAPIAGVSADYAWLVSVVRVKRTADGRTLLEAASPSSAIRAFTWE
ncbi:MAG: LysM peptidoglycan-binding domain-containing protein [Caldilineaceae bacterium]|nr:LysM peptidoglycan-binding domain-containing protein [Caldilineaceae bacterium]